MKECIGILLGQGDPLVGSARAAIGVRWALLFPFIAAVIIGVFLIAFPSTLALGPFLVTMATFSLAAYALTFMPLSYASLRIFIYPASIIAGIVLFWLLRDASRGHEVIYYVTVSQLILWGYTLVRTDFCTVLIACLTLSFIALLIAQMPPHLPTGTDLVGITLLIAVNLLGFYIIHSTRRLTGLVHSLSHKANTDEVTGVANRHYITELMQRECIRAKRAKRPFSLLLIDIDHFKGINDHYGHPAGDAVLRTLTNCIKRTIRGCDICGRYGGDEFAVLLTDSPPAGARLTAQRIVTAITESTTMDHGRRIDFNISIGIASCQLTQDHSLDALIRAADEALYQAKQEGRNRIHSAHDGERETPAASPPVIPATKGTEPD